MTDFLTRLAARAVGQAPALRPRPVSRFGAMAPGEIDVAAASSFSRTADRPGDPPATSAQRPHDRRVGGATPPLADAIERDEPPPRREVPTIRDTPTATHVDAPPDKPRQSRSRPETEPAASRRVAAREPSAHEIERPQATEQTASRETLHIVEVRAAPSPAHLGTPPPEAAGSLTRLAPRAEHMPSPAAATPMPEINVVIHRLEVRASAPPPRAARKPMNGAAPTLSLNDYLAGRSRR